MTPPADGSHPPRKPSPAAWLGWVAAAGFALLALCLGTAWQVSRLQLENLELLNRVTESALRESENRREADRLLMQQFVKEREAAPK